MIEVDLNQLETPCSKPPNFLWRCNVLVCNQMALNIYIKLIEFLVKYVLIKNLLLLLKLIKSNKKNEKKWEGEPFIFNETIKWSHSKLQSMTHFCSKLYSGPKEGLESRNIQISLIYPKPKNSCYHSSES